jgi:hypothetical protein
LGLYELVLSRPGEQRSSSAFLCLLVRMSAALAPEVGVASKVVSSRLCELELVEPSSTDWTVFATGAAWACAEGLVSHRTVFLVSK